MFVLNVLVCILWKIGWWSWVILAVVLIILGSQHKNTKWEDESTKIIWQKAVLSQ